QTGVAPLPTDAGIQCWEQILRSGVQQVLVFHGVAATIAEHLAAPPPVRSGSATAPVSRLATSALVERTEAYLKALIGEELHVSAERIGSAHRLESFGIDPVAR